MESRFTVSRLTGRECVMERMSRRVRTLEIAQSRKDEYQMFMQGPDKPAHFWAKQGVSTCNCRKRRKGRPRVDSGPCHHGARIHIYQMRSHARQLNSLVLRGVDPECDALAKLCWPVVR